MRQSMRSLAVAVALAAFGSLLAPMASEAQTAVLDISGGSVTEGDAGTTTVTFNIVCDPCDRVNAIVNWATMDGTATSADNDYVATSGVIDDLGNGTAVETYPVTVTVHGDTKVEGDETFSLKITNASVGCPSLGGPGGCSTPPTAAVATGTIVNDDSTPQPPEEEDGSKGCLPWLIALLIVLVILYLLAKKKRS